MNFLPGARTAADKIKDGCPASKLLKANITIDVKLAS